MSVKIDVPYTNVSARKPFLPVRMVHLFYFIIMLMATTGFIYFLMPMEDTRHIDGTEYVELLSAEEAYVQDGPYGARAAAYNLLQGSQDNCSLHRDCLITFPECETKITLLKKNWKQHPCYSKLGIDGSVCSIVQFLSEVEQHCPLMENCRFFAASQHAKLNLNLNELLRLLKRSASNAEASFRFIESRLKRMWPDWLEGVQRYATWVGPKIESSLVVDDICSTLIDRLDRPIGQPKLHDRPRLNIHIHIGSLWPTIKKGINRAVDHGGPLGELVQWTDLIATLHLLGHRITISSNQNQLSERFQLKQYGSSPCHVERGLVDLVFTDINGYKQMGQLRIRIPKCKFRLLDSFGTEAQFNHHKSSPWGNLKLNLKQFYTLFPHSPDNSFLGFVAEQYNSLKTTSDLINSTSKKPIALIYGKEIYMWKLQNMSNYLRQLAKYFELHANVLDLSSEATRTEFFFVKFHNRSYGEPYLSLLKSARVLVGLGFPFEGPAPVEAVANGVVFLNPMFSNPVGKTNHKFFADKPTSRTLSSQNPYMELYVGEPYSYLVRMDDNAHIDQTVSRLLSEPVRADFRPFALSPTGFIERLNALLTHSDLCSGSTKLRLLKTSLSVTHPRHTSYVYTKVMREGVVHWPPPTTSLRIHLADPGQSCSQACASLGSEALFDSLSFYKSNRNESHYMQHRIGVATLPSSRLHNRNQCAAEHFTTVNDWFTLEKYAGINCTSIQFETSFLPPYRNIDTGGCVFQADILGFSCASKIDNSTKNIKQLTRICPCTNSLIGQPTLCPDCL